jgi:hypothetical protein
MLRFFIYLFFSWGKFEKKMESHFYSRRFNKTPPQRVDEEIVALVRCPPTTLKRSGSIYDLPIVLKMFSMWSHKVPYGLFVLDDVLDLFVKFPKCWPPKLFQITPHFIPHPLHFIMFFFIIFFFDKPIKEAHLIKNMKLNFGCTHKLIGTTFPIEKMPCNLQGTCTSTWT